MYGETHSESKRVNKLNTVLWSCCLKQLFYGIDSYHKRQELPSNIVITEKREKAISQTYQASKSIYR